MSPLFPAPDASRGGEKDLWLETAQREHATTLRVLEAFPADQLELKPTPKSTSARDLAFLFVREQGLLARALTTGFDWSQPPTPAPAPATLGEIISALRDAHEKVLGLVRGLSEEELRTRTARFFTGPKQMGDVRLMDFLWMVLHDQIHHRGQMSVYIRLAGGRVPSIYGPSGDESWM